MEIELTTISTKKFQRITLVSIPFILLFSIGLAVLTNTDWFLFLILPFFILVMYLGQRLSETVTKIDLNEADHLKINNQEIGYHNVIGYFANNKGLLQNGFYIRLKNNEIIQIAGSAVGEQEKAFQKAQDEIIRALKNKNSQLLELEYQDVYFRQIDFLRPLLYVLIGLVIIIDIVAIYLLVTGKKNILGRIFYVNFLMLGVLSFLKKGKITNTNRVDNSAR